MPRVDEQAGEISVKIVYQGPGSAGVTTNLQYIYNKTRPEMRGKLVSIYNDTDQRLFFDFSPISLAPIGGLRLRFHLVESSGARYIEGAKERVLQDADGVVFVADSQELRLDANIDMMEQMAACIARQGRELASLPLVLQYNKRDLVDNGVVPVAELDAALNHYGRPRFEAVAPTGLGVFDSLKAIAAQILERLRAAAGAHSGSNEAT